jgi:hypothetical protein
MANDQSIFAGFDRLTAICKQWGKERKGPGCRSVGVACFINRISTPQKEHIANENKLCTFAGSGRARRAPFRCGESRG